jgi:folate-binding Fe-S cluster repair protein YgfZ
LISISGKGTIDFLQGLVTNDMRLLPNSPTPPPFTKDGQQQVQPSLYAFFLNSAGRVLFDTYIYGAWMVVPSPVTSLTFHLLPP